MRAIAYGGGITHVYAVRESPNHFKHEDDSAENEVTSITLSMFLRRGAVQTRYTSVVIRNEVGGLTIFSLIRVKLSRDMTSIRHGRAAPAESPHE